ncbi:1-acyl-sn-glycerol-3-phosphate acyltransferase [Bacteroidota bacterium]
MNQENNDLKIGKIDIKKVFYGKNPTLARILPNFFFNYLKKIVHEDFINGFIEKHGDKIGLDFARAGIKEFNVSSELKGKENIPLDKKLIIVSNHPLGGFDALLLLSHLEEYFPKVKFLVNDILMNVKNLKPLFIPINKHGGQSKESVIQIEEAYESDMQVATFPAGYVSRRKKGKIEDPEWQKSFIIKAIKYKRDVLPVFIGGRNTNFFYNLSNFRKFFGIKLNLEMLYLVDETYKHRNKHITITIGNPIPYSKFDKSKKPIEWAQYVKSIAYELPKV